MTMADREPRVAMANREPRAAMADREPRVAMANREPRVVMADREPRVAIANPGTRTAMADRVYGPPKKIFLGGSPAGEYPVRASGAEGELDRTSGDEGELGGEKASWTRPPLGGARKALILWGAGEEQALGARR